jgi:nicotinamidase-related amidase
MPDPLLVVDVQNGSLNGFTRHVPDRIVQLLARRSYNPILHTIFVNRPGSPYHRLLDWHGCEREPETCLAAELEPLAIADRIFYKSGLAGLPKALAEHLQLERITRIALAGIDTDMCVLKSALDLFDRGIEPIVLTDCCASTAGLQAHLAGLAILSRNIGPTSYA